MEEYGAGHYCGILLAAGKSRRFGGDKLLQPLAGGTPLALGCALRLRDALPQTVAVVARDNTALLQLFAARDIRTVAVDSTGMGDSLAAGVGAAPDAAGWVVALADMPCLRATTIGAVVAALRDGCALVAPIYQGQRGHPVGFDRRFRDKLRCLSGNEGARHLIGQHKNDLHLIECGDPGCVMDVDTPNDLNRVNRDIDGVD